MTKAIRIHPGDPDDDAVYERHYQIEKILDSVGPEHVKIALVHGGYPSGWAPIVHAWLAGDKLEEK